MEAGPIEGSSEEFGGFLHLMMSIRDDGMASGDYGMLQAGRDPDAVVIVDDAFFLEESFGCGDGICALGVDDILDGREVIG